ncbi:MiaB/RimO family radical SAM methylthiotransferase [candidate division WWE3 bacterium]|uniref:MiaB/RimO family radical SAM methylthiotransferase n=1 Tax=candidate division WWE3 bacterium TaxID=2053526 RepID=A0A7X9E6D2_UNCKA|nr:MiaB/RimO family radical SAM methylthiotransferase [candidate division WWE3 bacterium]
MSKLKKKKYYIKTFGCYANEVDSDVIAGFLEDIGFKELKALNFKNEIEEITYVLKNADLFIVNSCSVRQKSEDKVYGLGRIISNYKKEKEEGKRACVFLTGCVVGSALGERKRYSLEELKKKTRNYDYLFTSNDLKSFIRGLKEFNLINGVEIDGHEVSNMKRRKRGNEHAFVNVSYGCDNFCSYCVVPYSRGGEVSRTKEDILREIECLIKNGVKEVTLCGQNVNSWGLSKNEKTKIRAGSRKKLPFTSLLKEVCSIKELNKVDFISSNPFDFTRDLVTALKEPKISNYIHIAVQSGNNEILKAMNRRYSAEEFIRLTEEIRKVRPGIEIGTDLIVGFPGETERQFMDTVKLVKKVGFAVAFISMYSPRKGTYAQMNLKDDVSTKEKKWRHMYLTEVWKKTKEGKKEKKKGLHEKRK